MDRNQGRTTYQPQHRRRILCVFPRYARSFGTLHHAYKLMKGVRAFMPPQGILLIAAYVPESWEVRFIDENSRAARPEDYRWADAVFISGMHIQRPQINEINEKAHEFGKITVLGGPSVSGCPEYYPDVDLLQIGEMGDSTDRILEHLDRHTERPERQIRFETKERLPLQQFPQPAYHLINVGEYFLASIQFSSGCPYHCEFCDIPALYGNNPRLKTPEQVVAELDAMLESGPVSAVYFVDDNFVGNRNAALELLPHLIAWQQRNGYPVQFACEATLNITKSDKLLELMREAYFCTVFCGIETPEPSALNAMAKKQNLAVPLMEGIQKLNQYGMEVVSGIIMGLDTDTPETADRILQFIQLSNIPMLTINLLMALPRTPLWERLEKEGRLIFDGNLESNVRFRMPYDEVVEKWRYCISRAYQPAALYKRFAYNRKNTYPNRKKIPHTGQATLPKMIKGFTALARVLFYEGIRSNYRRLFWEQAWPALKAGDIEYIIYIGLVGHHLIQFARECVAGEESASFYSQRVQDEAPIRPSFAA